LGDLLGLLSQLFYQEDGMLDETLCLALWSHLSYLCILTLNLFDLLTDHLRLSGCLFFRLIVMPHK
jgi:hypothetical protein